MPLNINLNSLTKGKDMKNFKFICSVVLLSALTSYASAGTQSNSTGSSISDANSYPQRILSQYSTTTLFGSGKYGLHKGGILDSGVWGKAGTTMADQTSLFENLKTVEFIMDCRTQALKVVESDLQNFGLDLSSDDRQIAQQVLIKQPVIGRKVAFKMITCASKGGYALNSMFLDGSL